MADFELAGLRAGPGTVTKGYLGHVALAEGTKVGVPCIIVNGVEDGPTLVVTGSIHGTEVNGSGALLRVVRELKPSELKGRLIAIPAANPLAFQVGSYFSPFVTPTDGLNLSSTPMWPGNPNGRLTERLGAIIGQALQMASHVIDIHSNPPNAIPFTLINRGLAPNDQVRAEMDKMAEAWGSTVIESGGRGATGVPGSCVANGIPAMNHELTADLYLTEENAQDGQVGLTNVMKVLGMLEGELRPQAIPPMHGDFVAAGRLQTEKGGLMWVKVKPGQFLHQGETAIEMMDVWGDIVEEVKMPFDGYCWSFTGGIGSTHAVTEGTQIAFVFKDRARG